MVVSFVVAVDEREMIDYYFYYCEFDWRCEQVMTNAADLIAAIVQNCFGNY